jgi:uncharacterized pyridoxal phosphate-containing UPF0001 family protein/uncharacterized protein YggT (Ycf19 family)
MRVVPVAEIAQRRAAILAAVERAASAARRDPADVALMAVTKGQSVETVDNGAKAGLTLFGENRVQEATAKIGALRAAWPNAEWRLIGPLQTNKAKTAIQYFQVLESLDRERLAARLESLLAAEGRILPVLVEVNLGREPSKSGVLPEEADRLSKPRGPAPARGERADGGAPTTRTRKSRAPSAPRGCGRAVRPLRAPAPESMGMSHDYAVAAGEHEICVELRFGARRRSRERRRIRAGPSSTCCSQLQALQWTRSSRRWPRVNPTRATRSRFLRTVEPIFRPIASSFPDRTGNIDLSPLFVILIIFLLSRFLIRLASGI